MTSTQTAPSTTPQVAVNDIGTADDFLAAIDSTIKYFNDGDIVEGTIVKVDRDEVLLDIGYKTEGVIPSRELSIKHDVDPNEVVTVGDEIEALVLQKEDKEGRLILSKKRAQYERAWGTIEEKKERDEVVEGTVIEVVKGGLIIDIGLRGFLPASLVEMRRVRDLQPYVGKTLEAKIIELDKNRNNVVLSRRAWLEQTQSEVRSEFLNKLAKGQVRTGVVSSIVNFGAFVDLGGVDGLVHVSELSWKHIDHPSEVVEVGQEVTVEVLDIDLDRERVSLSLKATQEDPWRQFARTHQIGQVVPGKVTKLVPFGAFVRVQDGIEGLVHISELAERHVEIPEQVVNVGDDLLVKVIDIDLERRRISLSLKQANEGSLTEDSFDPAQYGMEAQYDDKGNYIYPDGFDPETQEWLPGYDDQREAWEKRYASARERFEAHKKQLLGRPEGRRGCCGRDRRRVVLHLGGSGVGRLARFGRGAGGAAREAGRSLVRRRRPGRAGPGTSSVVLGRVLRHSPNRHCRYGRDVRVALSGGVGSGKSTVARRLEHHGAVVIDADAIAREVVEPGTSGYDEVVARFGDAVVADGRLDRAAVAKIVFNDKDALADLNKIVHPRVGERVAELTAAAPDDAVLVYDVPLLAEKGSREGFDVVVMVLADRETRLERLAGRGMPRDGRRGADGGPGERRAAPRDGRRDRREQRLDARPRCGSGRAVGTTAQPGRRFGSADPDQIESSPVREGAKTPRELRT